MYCSGYILGNQEQILALVLFSGNHLHTTHITKCARIYAIFADNESSGFCDGSDFPLKGTDLIIDTCIDLYDRLLLWALRRWHLPPFRQTPCCDLSSLVDVLRVHRLHLSVVLVPLWLIPRRAFL